LQQVGATVAPSGRLCRGYAAGPRVLSNSYGDLSILLSDAVRSRAPPTGRWDMTLLHLHDVRPHGSAGAMQTALRRTVRRIGLAFKTIHRSIAAAKIHRLRNELLLHRDHEDWARMNLKVGRLGGDAERYPRPPVVLGEKWDY